MGDKELKCWTTNSNCLWVATLDEQVVGLVSLVKVQSLDETYELKRLSVKSECRRLGVGEQLIKTVIGQFQKIQGKCLQVKPASVRRNALKLYTKLGFKQIGVEDFQEGIVKFLPVCFTGLYRIKFELAM
jgi:ribosomal protein S18 acetylase RimI-like enzyme